MEIKYGKECKKFSSSDLELFAKFSGDRNPIHLDPIYARRTQFGAPIVFGVNLLLWAMDYLYKKHAIVVNFISIKFQRPVFLNADVEIKFEQDGKLIISQNGNINSVMLFAIAKEISKFNYEKLPLLKINKMYSDGICNFNVGERDEFLFSGDYKIGKTLFPEIFEVYGDRAICEIANSSFIVGMRCPGEHSIFVDLKINFQENHENSFYKITKLESRVGMVAISFKGKAINGTLGAFFRPKPSKFHDMQAIKLAVKSDEFKGQRILIIGGSRGIGEVVAKILAVGGGMVSITYNVGVKEAEKVAEDIRNNGGNCTIHQLKIDKKNKFTNLHEKYDFIYYFATPKILPSNFLGKSDVYEYDQIYVDGFTDVCNYFFNTNKSIRIFYPSTSFIEKSKPNLDVYINSKIKGEERCRFLRDLYNIDINVKRLPILQTDQNLSILSENSKDIVTVMLPIIREIQSL